MFVGESLEGQPPEDLGTCGQCLDQAQAIVEVEWPVSEEILLIE